MRCFIALPLPAEALAALAGLTRELSREWPGLTWVKREGYHLTLAFLGELDESGRACASSALKGLVESGFDFRFAGLGGFPPGGPWRVLYAGLDDAPLSPSPAGSGPGVAPGAATDGAFGAATGAAPGGAAITGQSPAARIHRALNEALRALELEQGRAPLNAEWKDEDGGRPFRAHITLARAGRRNGGIGPSGDAGRRPPQQLRPRDLERLQTRIETALAGQWTIDRCSLYKSELGRGGAVYTELDRVALGVPRMPGGMPA